MATEDSPMKLSPSLAGYYEPLRRAEPTKSDASLFPSYTRLQLPYRVICKDRYNRNARAYRRQFIKEIRTQELLMNRAIDGVRVHRQFQNPVVKGVAKDCVIKLTREQNFRLDKLLEGEVF